MRVAPAILALFLLGALAACGDEGSGAAPGRPGVDASDVPVTDANLGGDTVSDRDAQPDSDAARDADSDATSLDASIVDASTDVASGDVLVRDAAPTDASADAAAPDAPTRALFISSGDSFALGPLTPRQTRLDSLAPTPVIVWEPAEPGRYAVLVFQHGFLVENALYASVLEHIASHGFVVVAPQMYAADNNPIGKPSAYEEAALAAELYAWVRSGLFAAVDVDIDPGRLGLAGHSRGSKVIWAVLRDDPSAAFAIAGVDPVDGEGGPLGGEERVLASPVRFAGPTLVLGTGLGPVSGGVFSPACAPEGDNYQEFFAAAGSPAWQLVAEEYGHNDMLDEGCGLICAVCEAGDNLAPMRTWTAGLLTAFFRASLQGDEAELAQLRLGAPLPVVTRFDER